MANPGDPILHPMLHPLLNPMLNALAQMTISNTASGDPRYGWMPVTLLLVIGLAFAGGTLAMSILVGPSRNGPGKGEAYESGMNPIGDTRRRFNVRFYVVAILFLVFDVDIIFFYPLCSIYPQVSLADHKLAGAMLIDIVLFTALLLVAYLYAWGKGVFRWD